MPWSRVLGQDRAIDTLSHALESERVAGTYLFHGPSGSGPRAAALAFGQALLCERRGTPTGPAGDACGSCLACTKSARLIHPDLHVTLPFPKTSKQADKDDRPSDYSDRMAALAAEPYASADYRQRAALGSDGASNKQVAHRRIPMEAFRREMSFVPVEGRYVVGVLLEADRIRTEAANALLKLLEEPEARVVLILTAERVENVLPTILSRCQRVRFDPLAPDVLEAALVARAGVPATEAAVVARMADGSFTKALEVWGSESMQAHRALAVQFVREAYTGRPDRIAPVVQSAQKLGRESLKGWLDLVSIWIRDLVLVRAGAVAAVVNVDQTEAVQKFVAALPKADLEAMASVVAQAVDAIEGNAHAGLVLTALAFALRDAMHGVSDGLLVAPLDAA
ncbi:ATP-binding protein [Rubrivirga sp.]|uniref:DNA polymerase III subunit n=1 Tax=Rubrivirga sp. TaxID=1885344 RepID=UPI003C72BF3A